MGDVQPLNKFLDGYTSAPQVIPTDAGRLVLTRVAKADPVANLLGPVAEAVAQLLTDGELDLVKKCAHPECILWFYDRTKSHKRRWCSMASGISCSWILKLVLVLVPKINGSLKK